MTGRRSPRGELRPRCRCIDGVLHDGPSALSSCQHLLDACRWDAIGSSRASSSTVGLAVTRCEWRVPDDSRRVVHQCLTALRKVRLEASMRRKHRNTREARLLLWRCARATRAAPGIDPRWIDPRARGARQPEPVTLAELGRLSTDAIEIVDHPLRPRTNFRAHDDGKRRRRPMSPPAVDRSWL
jgi:hypothetical protein